MIQVTNVGHIFYEGLFCTSVEVVGLESIWVGCFYFRLPWYIATVAGSDLGGGGGGGVHPPPPPPNDSEKPQPQLYTRLTIACSGYKCSIVVSGCQLSINHSRVLVGKLHRKCKTLTRGVASAKSGWGCQKFSHVQSVHLPYNSTILKFLDHSSLKDIVKKVNKLGVSPQNGSLCAPSRSNKETTKARVGYDESSGPLTKCTLPL